MERVQQKQIAQKERHDNDKNISNPLTKGDKVLIERTWLKNNFSAKLEDKWTGPYLYQEI